MNSQPCLLNCNEHSCEPHNRGEVDWKGGESNDGKVSRRWYLTVIGLLYLGLIISFCLNITLLTRKSPAALGETGGSMMRDSLSFASDKSSMESSAIVEPTSTESSHMIRKEFMYTTACLVKGEYEPSLKCLII